MEYHVSVEKLPGTKIGLVFRTFCEKILVDNFLPFDNSKTCLDQLTAVHIGDELIGISSLTYTGCVTVQNWSNILDILSAVQANVIFTFKQSQWPIPHRKTAMPTFAIPIVLSTIALTQEVEDLIVTWSRLFMWTRREVKMWKTVWKNEEVDGLDDVVHWMQQRETNHKDRERAKELPHVPKRIWKTLKQQVNPLNL